MIDNCVYELKLSQIMKKCFSIFYFWFLYFDNENLIFEQQNKQLSFVAIDVNKNLWKMNEILNFKIDKKKIWS